MEGTGGHGSMNSRYWGGILEPSNGTLKNHLGLQLMSSMDEKPLLGGVGGVRDHHHPHPSSVMASTNGGPFHHHRVGGVSESHIPMEYWLNQNREKYPNFLSGNHHHGYYQSNYGVSPETSSSHSIQMPQQISVSKHDNVIQETEEVGEERDNGSGAVLPKKRGGKVPQSAPKEKKPRTRAPTTPRGKSNRPVHRARAPKESAELVINGVNMDISGMATPFCSCTGVPQHCYKWGFGGWQSACCTTVLSMFPLPMSPKKRGVRIAGRKMSIGAFKKVLEKLASEGYDFSTPIDLNNYWAKHGTNKFVTIR